MIFMFIFSNHKHNHIHSTQLHVHNSAWYRCIAMPRCPVTHQGMETSFIQEGIENLPWWTCCLFWLAPLITTIYRPFVFYQFIPCYTLHGHTWISIWCNCPFASQYLCFHFIIVSVRCSHTCNHHTIHLEVPVYWPTTFPTPQFYHNAQAQLHSLMVPSCMTPWNGFVCLLF